MSHENQPLASRKSEFEVNKGIVYDVYGDRSVNLIALLQRGRHGTNDARADIDGSGTVNLTDALLLRGRNGTSLPPAPGGSSTGLAGNDGTPSGESSPSESSPSVEATFRGESAPSVEGYSPSGASTGDANAYGAAADDNATLNIARPIEVVRASVVRILNASPSRHDAIHDDSAPSTSTATFEVAAAPTVVVLNPLLLTGSSTTAHNLVGVPNRSAALSSPRTPPLDEQLARLANQWPIRFETVTSTSVRRDQQVLMLSSQRPPVLSKVVTTESDLAIWSHSRDPKSIWTGRKVIRPPY